jgi:hypothetical protein
MFIQGRSNNELNVDKLIKLYPQIDEIHVACEKLFQRMQKVCFDKKKKLQILNLPTSFYYYHRTNLLMLKLQFLLVDF